MKPARRRSLLPLLEDGHSIQAGSHHGHDLFIGHDNTGDFLVAHPQHRSTGESEIAVTEERHVKLEDIRAKFNLQGLDKAASLASRVYRSALIHIWRGNHLTLEKPDQSFTRVNTGALHTIVTGNPAP